MKQLLYMLGLAILLSVTYSSCKEDTLEAMRDKELEKLDKYVKDHNLEAYKDVSGIYIKIEEPISTDSLIKPQYTVMLQYNIFLIDSTKVLSTEDENGYTFEEYPFFVDISNTEIDADPLQQIKGLHIGLKKMRIGDRALIVIPSELAYKAIDYSAQLGIPRFSTLLVYVYVKKGYAPGPQ